ncbi:MAG: DNA primase [Bacilli bacterium]|nr:DNA primase [Bacilli bacterium]
MAVLTNDEITKIRTSVDIVDIIGEYIPLTKKGRNFFGICPFHEENTPSMSVSKEKQIYKCFGCGASGNVITFVMSYEKMSFPEAIYKLATKAGIAIKDKISLKGPDNRYESLFNIYNISTKYYQNNINTTKGTHGKNYLLTRQLTDDIINEFQIGLALDKKDQLTTLLLKKGFTPKELITSGLTNQNHDKLNDVFINRIMFPLWDINGRVVGYSGRYYFDQDIAKYINTKETPIFKKGLLLYNYHRALPVARQTNTIIIVEGFMDVIRCYSIGIKNVVALMGTSITKEQAFLIKKMASKVILCFDGDEAGARATLSGGNELLKYQITPLVIRLEEEFDPDDYITTKGETKFRKKLDNPLSLLDFKFAYYRLNKDFSNSDDITKYINEVLEALVDIQDDIKQELILSKLSDEFKISLPTLKEQLLKSPNKPKESPLEVPMVTKRKGIDKYLKAEKRLLYYMLKSAEVTRLFTINGVYLPTNEARLLANEIIYYIKHEGVINSADFITYLNDKSDLIKLVGEVVMQPLKEEYSLEEINDYIKVINDYNIQKEIDRLMNLINQEVDIDKKVAYAEALRQLKVKE